MERLPNFLQTQMLENSVAIGVSAMITYIF